MFYTYTTIVDIDNGVEWGCWDYYPDNLKERYYEYNILGTKDDPYNGLYWVTGGIDQWNKEKGVRNVVVDTVHFNDPEMVCNVILI